jgi:hypothetical protein
MRRRAAHAEVEYRVGRPATLRQNKAHMRAWSTEGVEASAWPSAPLGAHVR